jgi:hypothetical protein
VRPVTRSVFWTTRDWATAIAELPAVGPLPCRTALVPREPVADALRRELIRAGRGDALGGIRFVPVAAAAIEMLHTAGADFVPGEAALRRARLAAVLRAGVSLAHFPLELLTSRPGWDEASAQTIADLEAAGLRPEYLETAGGRRAGARCRRGVARAAARKPDLARKARDLERLLADLRAVRPAIEALVAVARLVVARAPLADLWPALRAFLEEWLLQPGEGPRAPALLDERMAGASADAACGTLAGDEALRMIEDVIASVRLPAGRFGEPAVYVGTVREAASLPFRAVRVSAWRRGICRRCLERIQSCRTHCEPGSGPLVSRAGRPRRPPPPTAPSTPFTLSTP